MTNNIILSTDSYKLTHWNQYPPNTENVYSYFESRRGAEFDFTKFFGLQYIIKKYLMPGVTGENFAEAKELAAAHIGPGNFNADGWVHILTKHKGRLPLRIKAVPEGMEVPVGNVLMTVENTDPAAYWLTNAAESLLTHVWYPSTVATLSASVRRMLGIYLATTGGDEAGLDFMLHDFGYRGVSSEESAEIGGAAHLVNFKGTDTLVALPFARDYYGASYDDLAFSVPATEHSVMTAMGRAGEAEIVERLLANHPAGILSVVADSYNIYDFVGMIGSRYKKEILRRDGVFVVRPDSITDKHKTPEALVAELLFRMWQSFGGSVTRTGHKVLDPHVRVLWGDGIDRHGIEKILAKAKADGFAAENLVFGMGGGLLQKVNRDTQRFAFKSSAQKRDGVWHDVYKQPLDLSKASKRGRLKLVDNGMNGLTTVDQESYGEDLLEDVFLGGELVREQSFADVRSM